MQGEEFDVWTKSTRNLIDVSDVFRIAKAIIEEGECASYPINIAAPLSYPMLEIVSTFEKVLLRKARYISVDSGASYKIDTRVADKVAKSINLSFGGDYLERVIRKYYVKQ